MATALSAVSLVLLAAVTAGAGEAAVILRNPAPAAGEAPLGRLSAQLVEAVAREGGLRPMEVGRVQEAADLCDLAPHASPSAEQARRLAEALHSEVLVYGSAAVVGLEIEAHLLDTRTGAASAQTVSGVTEDVFDLIDLLGQRLIRSLPGGEGHLPVVAILAFQNGASPGSGLFVGGIPEMLRTNLCQVPGLAVVDGRLVAQGREALSLHSRAPLTDDQASALGRWVGADMVITGRFADRIEVIVDGVAGQGRREVGQVRVSAPRREMAAAMDRAGKDLGQLLRRQRRQTRTVAVLSFQNHSDGEYDRFVRGIADMLMTSLGQAERLTIIERIQIEQALRNFNLELSGPIDADTAVEVGAWLGADAVVLGSFLRFGATYRIDARLIDATTGEVMIAESARGPEDEVISMVDELGANLIARFGERETGVQTGSGVLEVVFRTTKAEMGERPVYHHICKLYVDGSFLGLSPVVRQADRWTPLFKRTLRTGRHQVQVVHGYARGDAWDGQMDVQPQDFEVEIEAGSTTAVRYTYEVGWFEDQYLYEPSWGGALDRSGTHALAPR